MTLETPGLRQGRLGSRKSNDGCITCKIRKVKCDEFRPACKRCQGTGRKCDGYVHNNNRVKCPASLKGRIVFMQYPTTYANSKQVEVQSFEFFMRQVVPGFTRIVDESFWHQIIPQTSHSVPVIWDAVIALSCLIQHPQYSQASTIPGSKKAPIANEEHRRALMWYNKSIAGLRKLMQQATSHSATAIISCILYICIECLQNNVIEAVALFRQAVVMMGITANAEDGCATGPVARLEGALGNTVRALLQNMSASHRLPIQPRRSLDRCQLVFQSLIDAREELYVLIIGAYEFVEHTIEIRTNQPKDWLPSPELDAQKRHLQTDFQKWHSALENFIDKHGSMFTQDMDEHYSVLSVAYGHYYILLSTTLSMHETAFDAFFPTFQAMIDHANCIIATGRKQPHPVFLFETRVIPSLFFVASKCRHPVMRRQAIYLLRNGAKMENTWKAGVLADAAERLVGIEESGNIHGEFCSDPCRIDLPPESNRVYRQLIIELQGADGQPASFVQFGRSQQDKDDAWFSVEHFVKLRAGGVSTCQISPHTTLREHVVNNNSSARRVQSIGTASSDQAWRA